VDDGPAAWDYLRSTYDTVAAKYEARFVDELRDKPRDRELLEAFARSVGDPVAEVGCGPGQIGAFVREQGRRVIGLDLSPEMTRLARARLDATLVADMRALPLATNSVGGLLSFYAVIHLQRAELGIALAEFQRVLRPSGRVLLSAHEGTDVVERDEFVGEPVPFAATFFQLDELVQASRDAGLEVTQAERRAPYATEGETVRLHVEAQKPDATTPGVGTRLRS
jgi:SAM-dependent methyltransferase